MSDDMVDAMVYAAEIRKHGSRELLLGALPPVEQSIARLGGDLSGLGLGLIWNAGRLVGPHGSKLAIPHYDALVVRWQDIRGQVQRTSLGRIVDATRPQAHMINEAARLLGLSVYGAVRK